MTKFDHRIRFAKGELNLGCSTAVTPFWSCAPEKMPMKKKLLCDAACQGWAWFADFLTARAKGSR